MTRWRRQLKASPRARGVILVLAALLLPVALGFAALAIDSGFLWTQRNMLQNTADAAALAGASALPNDPSLAQQLASEYIDKNLVLGNVSAQERQIILGHWDKGSFAATGPDGQPDAVRVIVGCTENLFFGPVIHVNTAEVRAYATATKRPADANISLVLDNSGSMGLCCGNAINDLRQATINFANRLETSPGHFTLGVTTFSFNGTLQQALTPDFNAVRQKLSAMTDGGSTNIASGILHGTDGAFDPNQGAQPIKDARKILILLSDGESNCRMTEGTCQNTTSDKQGCSNTDPVLRQSAKESALCEAMRFKDTNGDGQETKDDDSLLITISLGDQLDMDEMERIASKDKCDPTKNKLTKSCHYHAPTSANLDAIFQEILSDGVVKLVE